MATAYDDPNWLYHDHLDLAGALSDCEAAARRTDWEAAERLLARLVERLKQHVRIEEEVLFPAYEQTQGTTREPTDALRTEHNALVNRFRDVHYAVQGHNAPVLGDALGPLRELLARHNEKEERFFFPMAAHTLRDQRQAILARIEALDASREAEGERFWGF
jgi:iron-sulfur cluster repair protein YtfE (RIC family)